MSYLIFYLYCIEYNRQITNKVNFGFVDASTEKRNWAIISILFYVYLHDHKGLQIDICYYI